MVFVPRFFVHSEHQARAQRESWAFSARTFSRARHFAVGTKAAKFSRVALVAPPIFRLELP